MNENEEFEFRLRLEQEQAGQPSLRDQLEPGVMGDTVPTEMKLLENVNHVGGGLGIAQLGGAAVNAGLNLAGKAVAPAADNVAGWLAKKAEEQAVKAASPTTTNLEQIGQRLGKGPEGVRQTGRYMLDKQIVTPYADAEAMLQKVEPINQAAGETIGSVRNMASGRAQSPSPDAIKDLVGKELGNKYGPGLRSGEQGALNNAVDELTKQNPQNFEELAGVATDLNAFAKSPRSLTQPQEATTDVANIIARESDAGIGKVLTPEEAASYAGAKDEFGMTSNIKTILDRSQYRDMGSNTNIPLSHTGRISEAINSIMPASTRATIADKIANALRSNPNAFGKNGATLQRASQSGKAALSSTIYMLQQQDPEFKQQFEEMNRGQ